MNVENSTTDLKNETGTDDFDASEKEGIWQQIRQHFQTTQTTLSLRLVCKGQLIEQVGDVKTGVREAARMFTLHDSPQKAEELVASQENLFNKKCQQWDRAAKAAEAQERAKATGGASGGSSAANRRKLESAHTAVRGQISNAKQCFRRLRTALNRGLAYGAAKHKSDDDSSAVPQQQQNTEPPVQDTQVTSNSKTQTTETEPQESRLVVGLRNLIGDGLPLDYKSAPYKDPFCDEGIRSREAIWTECKPFCLIVQWEDGQNGSLNLRFWIVPKSPDLVGDLRVNLPELFLQNSNSAERLNIELIVHSSKEAPISNELNQLLNQIESARFLSQETGQQSKLSYLTCCFQTGEDFETATQQAYLLEIL